MYYPLVSRGPHHGCTDHCGPVGINQDGEIREPNAVAFSSISIFTRKRYSVGLADSAARGMLHVNNTPVKLKIIFAI